MSAIGRITRFKAGINAHRSARTDTVEWVPGKGGTSRPHHRLVAIVAPGHVQNQTVTGWGQSMEGRRR